MCEYNNEKTSVGVQKMSQKLHILLYLCRNTNDAWSTEHETRVNKHETGWKKKKYEMGVKEDEMVVKKEKMVVKEDEMGVNKLVLP